MQIAAECADRMPHAEQFEFNTIINYGQTLPTLYWRVFPEILTVYTAYSLQVNIVRVICQSSSSGSPSIPVVGKANTNSIGFVDYFCSVKNDIFAAGETVCV